MKRTFSKLKFIKYLDRSNTTVTPWHPLKYVETIDRYCYEPAVSHKYNLTFLLSISIFFILKSTVVTNVFLLAKN
jgi:hypothetical protein